MAITVACAACEKKYRVGDDKAGSVIRCKDCGEKIRIPDGDDDFEESEARPAQRKSATGKKKKKSGSSLGLILGLVGGGVFLLLLLGGIGIWMIAGRTRPSAPVANGPGPVVPAVPGTSGPSGSGGETAPAGATGWSVIADPPKVAVTWPAQPPKLDGFRGSLSDLKFSSAGTPFIVTGSMGTGDYLRVFNLATGELVGQFDRPRPNLASAKVAVSADGLHLAVAAPGKKEIEVWSVRDAKLDKTIPLKSDKALIEHLEMVPGQVIAVVNELSAGNAARIHVLEVATGSALKEIPIPPGATSGKAAVSPGFRFLAVDHGPKEWMVFYDLTRGAAAGRIPPGEYSESVPSFGMRFSPDGTRLAILGSSSSETFVSVVDLATGKSTRSGSIPGTLVYAVPAFSYSNSPAVQWLDNGQGWLVYGNVILDAASKRPVWKVLTEPNEYNLENGRARFAAGDAVWSVDGTDSSGVLNRIEIPWAMIRERLAKLGDDSNLVKSGAGVSLQVEVKAVRFAEAATVKQELEQALMRKLTSMGLKPGDGQPLVMRVEYSEAAGYPLEFGGLGGQGPKKTVEATKSQLDLKLTDAGGQTAFWSHSQQNNPRSIFMRGEPTPETVRKESFDTVLSTLRGVSLPDYVSANPADQLPVTHLLPRW